MNLDSSPWRNGGPAKLGGLTAVLVALIAGASWFAVRVAGVPGLAMLAGALVGLVAMIVLMARFPVVVCMIWFVSMSGLQAIGMIRMPGLPDFSLARLFMVLVMLLGALALVSGRQALRPPYGATVLLVIHAAYVLLNMYSSGVDSRFNTWLASSFAPVVGFMFAKDFVSSERHLRVIFATFIVISVYFWITCVGEKLNMPAIVWPQSILDRNLGISWFGRSRGPFLQPGLTGQFLGWFMMAQVYMLTRTLPRALKSAIVVNIALCAVALFLTYTRGPWLATVMGFLAMSVLRPKYRRIFATVLVLGFVVVQAESFQRSSNEFLSERLNNTSTIENRLSFLAAATRMIHDKPLFGVGYFRYLELEPMYNKGTYIPFYGFVSRRAGAAVPIHDIYIGRAAEEGIVSIVLFFWVLYLFAKEFRRRWGMRADGTWFDRDFLALYVGVMVSYFVNGMTLDYRYFDFVNVFPYFMSGILIGYPFLASNVHPSGSLDTQSGGSVVVSNVIN